MERVNIYKVNKTVAFALLIIGAFFLVTGIGILIETKFAVFHTTLSMINWSPLIFMVQGILFAFLGYMNLRSGKYYFQWDDQALTWHLPGNRQAETVQLADIRGVDIHLYAIRLELADGSTTISLDNINYKELRRIKEKLEEIKLGCERSMDIKPSKHVS